ncbi:hypothetical protein K3495_g10988 [Podosphaera aphanis]|nr:hypothetical protein K3495_g10988 [Podosphaera aphanis]
MSRVIQSCFKDPIQTFYPQNLPSFTFSMTSSRPTFVVPFPNNKTHNAPNISPQLESYPIGGIPLSSAGRKRSRTGTNEGNTPASSTCRQITLTEKKNNREDFAKSIESTFYGLTDQVNCKKRDLTSKEGDSGNTTRLDSNSPSSSILGSTKYRGAKSPRLDTDFSSESNSKTFIENSEDPITPLPEHEYEYEISIDKISRKLGVGWSLLSNANPDIQSAARGWAKFIENYYPITKVKIHMQSKGLASYLVEASEGYFLFGENLKHGRLVSVNPEKACINLQGPVPIFDGDVVMEASRTPNPPIDSFPITPSTTFDNNQTVLSSNEPIILDTKGAKEIVALEVNMDIC